jgi:calcineurin-like phosphoesterase
MMVKFNDFINENEEISNYILDKITDKGIDSLTNNEKEFLNQYSKGKVDNLLSKHLHVQNSNIIKSKNFSGGLSFELISKEHVDDEILYQGTVYFYDIEYDGIIYCDEHNNYLRAEFNQVIETPDGDYKLGNELYDLDDKIVSKIERFFQNEVIPSLK